MKHESDVKIMLKEAGILFLITLFSGLVLGFVYEITKESRHLQQEKAVQAACAAVFANASEFEVRDFTPSEELLNQLQEMGVEIGTVFEAKDAEKQLLGYVVETTSTQGYAGDIVLYTGIRIDQTINDISILQISETPGLGMRAGEVLVPQFHEKKVASFVYTKSGSKSPNEIDAISGATVTTNAVTNAVNGGLLVSQEIVMGGDSNE